MYQNSSIFTHFELDVHRPDIFVFVLFSLLPHCIGSVRAPDRFMNNEKWTCLALLRTQTCTDRIYLDTTGVRGEEVQTYGMRND